MNIPTTKNIKTDLSETETRRPAGILPSGFALLLAILWGGNNVSLKTSLKYGSALQVGWIRFALGWMVIFGFMIIKQETLKITKDDIKPVAVIGALFSVQMVFMNVGQDLTTAGHALAVNTTYPIWAATIAHIIIPSDRLNRWKVVGILLSYGGILIVVFGDTGIISQGGSLLGDLLSLVSAMLLGLRIILISNYAQTVSETKLLFGQALVAIPLFLSGSYLLEQPVYTLEPQFLFALAYQGFVIAGFGFLGNAWLIKKYLPSTISFFYFIQPVAGLILAWAVLGEEPGSGLIIGLILVCMGAIAFSSESIIKARRHNVSSNVLK